MSTKWIKGQSGNPHGRPRLGLSLAEKVRLGFKKHKLLDKLLKQAAGIGEFQTIEPKEQQAAIRLLMAYGWGQPVQMIDKQEKRFEVKVIYVNERSGDPLTSAAPSAAARVERGEAVRSVAGRQTVRQIDSGTPLVDERGT